jgi:hypothetical protein
MRESRVPEPSWTAINPLTPVLVAGREPLVGLGVSLGLGFAVPPRLPPSHGSSGGFYRRSLSYVIERTSA